MLPAEAHKVLILKRATYVSEVGPLRYPPESSIDGPVEVCIDII